MNDNRHLAKVAISLHLLGHLIVDGQEHHIKVTNGIPADAEYIGSTFDTHRLQAFLIFYHPSFEPVAEAAEIPEVVPVIKALPLIELPFPDWRPPE